MPKMVKENARDILLNTLQKFHSVTGRVALGLGIPMGMGIRFFPVGIPMGIHIWGFPWVYPCGNSHIRIPTGKNLIFFDPYGIPMGIL